MMPRALFTSGWRKTITAPVATENPQMSRTGRQSPSADGTASDSPYTPLLSAILKSSHDAIVSKSLEGIIWSWNRGAERLFGWSAAEAVGQPIALIIPRERHQEEEMILARLRRGEKIDQYETIRVRKDGRRIDISLTISPMRNSEGRLIGAVKIGRDITDRRRAEEALKASEERQAAVLEQLPVGVGALDRQGQITIGNAVLRELLRDGIPSRDPEIRSRWKAVDSAGRPIPLEQWPVQRALRGEHVSGMEFIYTDEQSHQRWLLVTATPFRGGENGTIGALCILQDISELKRAEEALREADRVKDEFLAVLGHELRNPLAPIRTGLDLLEQAPGDQKVIESVRPMLKRQVTHLVRLVDDLLDISRVNRGKINLDRSPLDLAAPVRAALEQTKPLIAERRCELILHLSDAPVPIHGDLERLTQVAANLLTNAAKYNQPGGTITVTTEIDERGHGVLKVKDTGFGIPPDQVNRLFKFFSQIPEHQARTGGGGLGIGLALSHQLITMHGGTMEVQSEGLGQGSEFVVRLPLNAAAQETARVEDQAQGDRSARRVLVVDDNVDAAQSLCMLLERQGHLVEVAYEGRAALQEIDKFRPEVLLLDLGLPGMDGIEVAKHARATPAGQNLLLIAVTGWGQEADKSRTREAGFNHHLTKPVDAAELDRLLQGEW